MQAELSIELFTLPSLRQIAEALFELIKTKANPAGVDLLARVESVEMSDLITDLMQVGQQKGNYSARLRDALDVLRQGRGPDRRHNLGMIE